ncbi:hypothetical protein [Haloprofundus halophilus]|uniref:hypothetical protein n=1 Tax=Haloprofundus halophilus TaxID=2283527 RepID=UPI000E449060|nr:hypothetical protein [Haloprofundus halophilus]
MSNKIHIEGGDRRPVAMRDYLDLIEQYEYESEEDVITDAYQQGYELGEIPTKNMVSTLSSLGIVAESDGQELTDFGRDLVDVLLYDEQLFYEMLHFRFSTVYGINPSPNNMMSWAYYEVSNILYNTAPIESFSDIKQDLADDIIYRSDQMTGPGFDDGEPGAFSRKSINGYQKFIEVLEPPVIEGGVIDLRSYAREELIISAIDYIYRSEVVAPTLSYGDLLELSNEIEEVIGTVCLLAPQSIDEMIEQTAAGYDSCSVESDHRVRVRLREEVNLSDLT